MILDGVEKMKEEMIFFIESHACWKNSILSDRHDDSTTIKRANDHSWYRG